MNTIIARLYIWHHLTRVNGDVETEDDVVKCDDVVTMMRYHDDVTKDDMKI